MHEYSLAIRLAEIVEEQRQAHGVRGRALRVVVVVGDLSGVVGEALAEAFRVARVEAGLPDAEVEVVREPLRLACHACGREWLPEDAHLLCERCGATEVAVIGGRELLVQSVEFEEFEEDP